MWKIHNKMTVKSPRNPSDLFVYISQTEKFTFKRERKKKMGVLGIN